MEQYRFVESVMCKEKCPLGNYYKYLSCRISNRRQIENIKTQFLLYVIMDSSVATKITVIAREDTIMIEYRASSDDDDDDDEPTEK